MSQNTIEQALAKMQKYVDFQNNVFLWNHSMKADLVIQNDLTKEYEFGWVFFWQVRKIKKDHSNVIGGNGPIIIEKDTLDMYAMMTALSIEENLQLYLEDKQNLAKLEMDEDGFFDVVNINE